MRGFRGESAEAALVAKYIGTSFDVVKFVHDNLEDVKEVSRAMELASSYLFYSYTGTAGQTSFTGSDLNGRPLQVVGLAPNVFVDGVRIPQGEVTIVSPTQISLANGVSAGSKVMIAAFGYNADGTLYYDERLKGDEVLTIITSAVAARDAALVYKNAAAASAAAAAASEANAALAANFNPTDFYTRTQTDTLLTTATFTQSQITGLSTALAGKSAVGHTHSTSDVVGLSTALAGKLDTTGNAASASKLNTPRSIGLTGAVTGSGNFDGSGNLSIETTSNIAIPAIASQVEAEAGSDNTKMMTPQRVAQAIEALAKRFDEQIFTASGTWTKPAGYSPDALVLIEAWGGGGGGGRDSGAPFGGGGGGGGYTQRWMRLADLPATVAVTIGAGGAGRTGSNGDGSTGGNSTFGAFLTAYGGGGGQSAQTTNLGGGGGGELGAGTVGQPGLLGGGDPRAMPTTFQGYAQTAFGGGAGGTGAGSSPANGPGKNAVYGGGGGGGGVNSASPTAGGTSLYGGAGGTGGDAAPTPTDGVAPAGGGGGGAGVNGGNGARGEIRVRIYQ